MDMNEFLKAMKEQQPVVAGSELMEIFHKLSQEALKITAKINNQYNTPEEIIKLFSELTGKEIDA